MAATMRVGQNKCQTEVREVFEKLIDWRNECHRQFSDIVDSHRGSISKRVDELVEEVCELKSQLTVVEKEKTILIETVDNLNREMREMKSSYKHLQGHEENSNQSIGEKDGSHDDISVKMEPVLDSGELDPLTKERAQANNLVLNQKDSSSILSTTVHNNDKSDYHKKADGNYFNSDELVCMGCNFEFSTHENLLIHIKNVHSEFDDRNEASGNGSEIEEKSTQSEQDIALEPNKASTAVENMLQNGSNNGGHKILDCEPTSLKAKSRKNMKRLKSKMHNGRDNVCDECGYTSSFSGALKRHKDYVHGKRDKILSCDICPFRTHTKEYLKAHLKKIHSVKRGIKDL